MNKLIIIFFIIAARLTAANWYVDSIAKGSGNGTSWTNAWTALGAANGPKPGDTIFISGGPTGSSQTYSFIGAIPVLMGSSGNKITYQIGQDALHNGIAIFNQTAVGFSYGTLIYGAHDVALIGDAGDGVKHFKVSGTINSLVVLQGTDTNVRLAYFDLGTLPGIGSINPGSKIEVDHIDIKVGNYPAVDRALYFNISGNGYDDSSVHDCNIQLPYNPNNSNFGPDGIQGGGAGYSIYKNTITGYQDFSLTTTQHMDGVQILGGNYIKAYQNRICNMTNYGMYWEAYYAVFNHLRIYDNVISVTDPVLASGSSGGIVVEQKIKGMMNDIVVANNTIADLQAPGSRTLTMLAHLSSNGSPYTNSVLANNALVNGNSPETDAGAPSPQNNVNVSASTATVYFSSYTKYNGLKNDFTLLPAASPLISKGVSVSNYGVITDFNGNKFASPPSVGAYEFSGAITPPPVVVPPVVVPPIVTPPAPATINVTVKLVIDPVSNSVLSVSATTQ